MNRGGRCLLAGFARVLRWGVLLASLAVVSLFAAWHTLAAADFGYSLWYDVLAIDETIATYGPENRLRPGFEQTDRAERERLFGAIVDAIHDEGRGLETLVYHTGDGRALGRLLTEAEIVHLQDVAALVDVFARLVLMACAAIVLLVLAAALRRERPPAGRHIAGATVGLLVGATALVLLIGPVRVFYWLHEVLFPPEHEWFFYYQESLMSMLMQAPNLFAPIAVVWVLLAVVVGGVLWFALTSGLRRLADRSS